MGKEHRRGLQKRLETALDLPSGLLYPALAIELSANRQAIIEGYRRILCYEENCIRLETVEGELRFEGENLTVNCLSAGSAVVTGRFVNIGFCD